MKRLLHLTGVLYVLLALFATPLSAQTNTRLLIPPFQGAKPQGLRQLTVELLGADGFETVNVNKPPRLRTKDADSKFASAAAEHEALAIVLASTSLNKKRWRTVFSVREGKTGKAVGEMELSSTWYPGLQKAYREDLVSQLRALLDKATPAGGATADEADAKEDVKKAAREEEPEESEPPADAETDEPAAEAEPEATVDEASSPQGAASSTGTAALIFNIGPGGVLRNWNINDPLNDANDGPLLSAHSAPTVGLRVGLQVFPAAFFTQDSIRHIGLEFQLIRSFIGDTNVANVTSDPDDESRRTTIQSYFAGLHIRIPAGRLQFAIVGGLGADALEIEGSKTQVAVPDIDAQFVRGGLNGRFAFLPTTSAQIGVGYRHVLSLGDEPTQVQAPLWFPNARGTGLDVRLELLHQFSSWFGLSLGGGLTHYALDFGVLPERIEEAEDAGQPPPPIAGGATDVYTAFDLNAVFFLGD